MSIHRKIGDNKSSRSVKLRSKSRSIDLNLNSITEIEESGETVAKEIMGEILEKALKQIHERYMDQQLIKFVVHCSHQALMKALRIHFYQHNDYIRNSLFWGSEKRPEPSYPDSWALDQVPVSKNMSEEEELNTLSRTKLEMGLKGAEIVVDSTVDLSSEPSETLLEDIKEMINDIINNLPVKYEETPEKIEPVVSAFTLVVEGEQSYTDFKMKPQLSRVSVESASFIKLPKIDLSESAGTRKLQKGLSEASIADDTTLPPIRTDAKYRCLSNVLPEEKPKKTKKK